MYVYLINVEGTSRYKIGVSKNTNLRLKALQTANSEPLALIKEFETKFGYRLEAALHKTFAHKKTSGEWFDLELAEVGQFREKCEMFESMFQTLVDQNTYIQDKKSW